MLLNFAAAAPIKWKAGLIFCFLHRAWMICSSSDLFKKEVNLFCDTFHRNGYPIVFFQKVYEKFYKRVTCPNVSAASLINASDVSVDETRNYILKLPFIKKAT